MLAAFDVKNSLVNLLAESAGGRYEVSGLRNRKTDAADVLRLPQVTVYYKSGQFPRNSSSVNGPYQHEATLTVSILSAAVTEFDTAAIMEGGTPEQIAAALAAKQDAEVIADRRADETASILFDLVMRPQNRALGMDDDPNRWITEYTKGDPASIGEIVILGASFTLTVQVPEYTTEETGTPGTGISHGARFTGDPEDLSGDGADVKIAAPLSNGPPPGGGR